MTGDSPGGFRVHEQWIWTEKLFQQAWQLTPSPATREREPPALYR